MPMTQMNFHNKKKRKSQCSQPETHTQKTFAREKKKKQTSNAETKRQTNKSKFYNL